MKYSITIIGTKPEVTLTIDFKPPKITNDVKIVNTIPIISFHPIFPRFKNSLGFNTSIYD